MTARESASDELRRASCRRRAPSGLRNSESGSRPGQSQVRCERKRELRQPPSDGRWRALWAAGRKLVPQRRFSAQNMCATDSCSALLESATAAAHDRDVAGLSRRYARSYYLYSRLSSDCLPYTNLLAKRQDHQMQAARNICQPSSG